MNPMSLPGGGGGWNSKARLVLEPMPTTKRVFRSQAMKIANVLWILDMKQEAMIVIREAFECSHKDALEKMANAYSCEQSMIDYGRHSLWIHGYNIYGQKLIEINGSEPPCICKPCLEKEG